MVCFQHISFLTVLYTDIKKVGSKVSSRCSTELVSILRYRCYRPCPNIKLETEKRGKNVISRSTSLFKSTSQTLHCHAYQGSEHWRADYKCSQHPLCVNSCVCPRSHVHNHPSNSQSLNSSHHPARYALSPHHTARQPPLQPDPHFIKNSRV